MDSRRIPPSGIPHVFISAPRCRCTFAPLESASCQTLDPSRLWKWSLPEQVLFQFLWFYRLACASRKNRKPIVLGLPLFVCMRFQDLFHSPPGVLFAFPSRYLFTIGRLRVFSLGGWSPHLQTGFLVSRPTYRALSSTEDFSHTGLSPTMAGLSIPF